MSYHQKYLKYKKKYIDLQSKTENQIGGEIKKISGPVNIWIGNYQGDRYILMGDVHINLTLNICQQDCMRIGNNKTDIISEIGYGGKTFELGGKKGTYDACYEITRLFSEIFDNALQTKQYIDFFHEIPFIKKNQTEINRLAYSNYLNKIDAYFSSCFLADKKACPWKDYVRFHYTDIRMTHDRKTQLFMTIDPVEMINLNFYGLLRFMKGIKQDEIDDIRSMLSSDLSSFLLQTIAEINYCIIILQKYNIFNHIFFNSNNYIQDIDNYFIDIEREINEKIVNIDIKNQVRKLLSVKRKLFLNQSKLVNGGSVSYIKKQLDNLEKDNPFVHDKLIKYKNDVTQEISLLINSLSMSGEHLYIESTDTIKVLNNLMTTINIASIDTDLDRIRKSIVNDLVTRTSIFEKDKLDRFKTIMTRSSVYYMDIYLLARLFRKFTSTTFKPHTPSKTKIIYAGAMHIINYINFFEKYLGMAPEKIIGPRNYYKEIANANRCIDSPYPNIIDFINKTTSDDNQIHQRVIAIKTLDNLKKYSIKLLKRQFAGEVRQYPNIVCRLDELTKQMESQKSYIPSDRLDDLNKSLSSAKGLLKEQECAEILLEPQKCAKV